MQTSITQTLALVVFGNKFLAGRSVEGFWPNATVFEFCRDVKFLDRQGQALAPNPQVWFERLKPKKARALKWLGKAENADTVGLQLRYGSTGKDDRSTVGFVGGGGHWLIEQVTRSGKCRLWEGHWELGDRNAPDQKIWDVSYRCTGDGKPSPVQPTTLIPSIRDQLDKVLREIAVFAQEAGANQFASSFERAYLALNDTKSAMSDLDAIARSRPDNPDLLTVRGLTWLASKDYARAIADFDKAIAKRDTMENYIARGRAYEARNDTVHAAADYRHALELKPRNVFDLVAQASIRQKLQQLSKKVPCGSSSGADDAGTCL